MWRQGVLMTQLLAATLAIAARDQFAASNRVVASNQASAAEIRLINRRLLGFASLYDCGEVFDHPVEKLTSLVDVREARLSRNPVETRSVHGV